MKRVELPYGAGHVAADVEGFEVSAVRPRARTAEEGTPAGDPLEEALDSPLGSPHLEALVRPGARVLLVISDGTRVTAADRVIPAIRGRLRRAGVRAADLRLVVASGLHTAPGPAELERLVGAETAATVPRIAPGSFTDLGITRRGTPIQVHSALRESDAVVLTGAIGFHYFAGFTGGRKSVLPGLASPEAIARNHLLALAPEGDGRHPMARAGVLDQNPVHLDMAEACARVAPAFLVNIIAGPGGTIEAAFAGHWDRAHREGCRELLRRRCVRFGEPADLVLVSAGGHPGDIDLVQSHKAMEAALPLVRPGGAMVVVAACTRGVGHPQIDAWLDGRNAAALAEALRQRYEVYGQTAHALRSKAEARRIWLVSGLPPGLVFRAGMKPAADLPTALAEAREHLGGGGRAWVLERGAALLPVPGEEGSGPRPPVDTPPGATVR